MKREEYIEFSDRFLMNTYSRTPLVFERGEGVYLWDFNGRKYLDFVSGLSVNSLGYCHSKIVKEIKEQSEKLLHVSNLYYIASQSELGKKIVELSIDGKAFFCNSGAEANEAAIKLTRKYSKEKYKKDDRYEIITMEKSFHGRTITTITATGQEKYQKGFEPLSQGFKYVPFNNIKALKDAITERTCAVMVEPIQGEGGVNIADEQYIRNLRKLCDEKGLLLVFDEVQTGVGRTGKLFAFQHYGIEPDIFTLAKGLGGGVPIGAMVAKKNIADFFTPGSHASTFGGNPFVCSVSLAVLETIEDERVLENCEKSGKYLVEKLNNFAEEFKFIKEVRGKGLLVGMELTVEGKDFVSSCIEKGLLINCTMNNVLRFLPPLIVKEKEVDEAMEIFGKVLKEISIRI
ncbi:MAG: acetylornithine aminotransferase [Candidatus Schekmanbacteria bacterium RIFCSPHIGHO2_02_FULL_38_11]|uniref:Acetylornithine aminotransferase n=1 Tax=Candidatus Schekmanbacteria bacterium RIFCSPLOWO2_12_FULL_38_15 TaxID=1817883 RepID=A0A1F7SI14_9BACT|nr:MAG: acetylornithine aminotransferase [Candidatus Schekmanbacteria bacterium GWA2_38_9]OGL50831.1 MAG: acetylornithine aminotransferase [Candidatus Schekmanbacteria bacterium RIFCSPLOWO2_02_FULL_38_14]OGL53409.1 MAG: acetylornithine aminotransferase [Candidatus Schekmanbacteria bacterium RIFCSPLOWO2_12_FULL_38_15]OGL55761.1 MAG: acetylornithine aminotransferase [Candidatus Schekmanbacteria bacterium RIFCSPHIGHO2_02_FULL_38_11]